jgi:hypothetical protein
VNFKYMPLYEIIELALTSAINIPGLAHIRTSTTATESGGKIDFHIQGSRLGVTLTVNDDGSYVLVQPDEPCAISWTAKEAQPAPITAAVIDALRARVRAAA